MANIYQSVMNWLQREEGQDVVEYAVLVVFIAFLIFIGVNAFGTNMNTIYANIASIISAQL